MNQLQQKDSLTLRGVTFAPALFCAPMAAITHSAFRRLLAGFGGYGALFTEMLSAKMILHESMESSPWLKRRPEEGKVIYQLMVMDKEHLPEIIDRLASLKPDGLDLNIACAAHTVVKQGGGADLFEDMDRLREIIRVMRKSFPGPLTAKIRLGHDKPSWQEKFTERLKLLEGEGVDALTVHPRFYEEKFKRSARHEFYAGLASDSKLPIIANGDINGPDFVNNHAAMFTPVAGMMVGRMAAACPWIFAMWHNPGMVVDHAGVWNRLCDYIVEDFIEAEALIRMKIIVPYFARNFMFGHELFKAVHNSPDVATARERAAKFFTESPGLVQRVDVSGI